MPSVWLKYNLETAKADDNLSDSHDDVMLHSTYGNSQSDEAILSLFLLDTKVISQFFLAKEDWSIIIHQQYGILMFSSSSFWIEQWLYFASPAECLWEIAHMSVSRTSVV